VPEVSTLQVRLAWLRGNVDRAACLLREALAAQWARAQSALEIAPYHVRLDRLLLDSGRIDEAEA
jgi:hypothetical protein